MMGIVVPETCWAYKKSGLHAIAIAYSPDTTPAYSPDTTPAYSPDTTSAYSPDTTPA